MSMRQLWEGNDSAPWIRHVTGETKLLVLLSYSVWTLAIDNPETLFYLFAGTLGLHLVAPGPSGMSWPSCCCWVCGVPCSARPCFIPRPHGRRSWS